MCIDALCKRLLTFSFQTMVTPLTQKFFGYGELENSVMYCLCGVEVIAGFLFVRWLSRRVAERVVLAVGLTICNISGVWCLIFLVKPLGQTALKKFHTFVYVHRDCHQQQLMMPRKARYSEYNKSRVSSNLVYTHTQTHTNTHSCSKSKCL